MLDTTFERFAKIVFDEAVNNPENLINSELEWNFVESDFYMAVRARFPLELTSLEILDAFDELADKFEKTVDITNN